MRQIGWEDARKGDVVCINGRELVVWMDFRNDDHLYVTTPDGSSDVACHIILLEAMGATLHRPQPKLPLRIGAVVKVGEAVYTRCKRGAFHEDNWIRNDGIAMRESALSAMAFEVLSEGVEVPE